MRRLFSYASLLLALLAGAPTASAQEFKPKAVIRINRIDASKFPKIRFFFSELDSTGELVERSSGKRYRLVVDSLSKGSFKSIKKFRETGETMAVVFVLQASPAMSETLPLTKKAVKRLIKIFGAKIKVGLVAYTNVVMKKVEIGPPKNVLKELDSLQIEDTMTVKLEEGIKDALELMDDKKLPLHKTIVVVSDGLTADLKESVFNDLGKRATEAGVVVHTIGFALEPLHLRTLYELSKTGNGSFRSVSEATKMTGAFLKLQTEMTNQVVASWELPDVFDGDEHDFGIRVSGGTLHDLETVPVPKKSEETAEADKDGGVVGGDKDINPIEPRWSTWVILGIVFGGVILITVVILVFMKIWLSGGKKATGQYPGGPFPPPQAGGGRGYYVDEACTEEVDWDEDDIPLNNVEETDDGDPIVFDRRGGSFVVLDDGSVEPYDEHRHSGGGGGGGWPTPAPAPGVPDPNLKVGPCLSVPPPPGRYPPQQEYPQPVAPVEQPQWQQPPEPSPPVMAPPPPVSSPQPMEPQSTGQTPSSEGGYQPPMPVGGSSGGDYKAPEPPVEQVASRAGFDKPEMANPLPGEMAPRNTSPAGDALAPPPMETGGQPGMLNLPAPLDVNNLPPPDPNATPQMGSGGVPLLNLPPPSYKLGEFAAPGEGIQVSNQPNLEILPAGGLAAPVQQEAKSGAKDGFGGGGWDARQTIVFSMSELEQSDLVAWIVPLEDQSYPTLRIHDEFVLGSDPACNYVVQGSGVEPRHAILDLDAQGYWLRYAAHERATDSQLLQDGDRFRVGDRNFVFKLAVPFTEMPVFLSRLEVLDGTDKGRTVPLQENVTVAIGSHPSCAVVIRGEGMGHRHALAIRQGDTCYFEDLGAEGGVSFDGALVGSKALKPGQEIVLGRVRILFVHEE